MLPFSICLKNNIPSSQKRPHRQRSSVRPVGSGAYAGADLSPGSSNALSASVPRAIDQLDKAPFQNTRGQYLQNCQKLVSIHVSAQQKGLSSISHLPRLCISVMPSSVWRFSRRQGRRLCSQPHCHRLPTYVITNTQREFIYAQINRFSSFTSNGMSPLIASQISGAAMPVL